ncbi:MAG: hypothetical protein AMXMBFR84_28080 [Candidatus Hydrogenedentota bacterium]
MSGGMRSAWDRWANQNNTKTFDELVKRYSGMVYGTCRRMLGDSAEAEDATQECFVALAQSQSVRQDAVGAWLYGVATRKCLHRLRTNRRRLAREDRYAAQRPESEHPQWNDIHHYVDEAVAELPSELREPLVARYVEGQTLTAIARRLGVPRRTLSHRIERAIGEVGKGLKRRGVSVGALPLAGLLHAHMAEAAPIPGALAAMLDQLATVHSEVIAAGGGSSFVQTVLAKLGTKAAGIALTAASLAGIGFAGFWLTTESAPFGGNVAQAQESKPSIGAGSGPLKLTPDHPKARRPVPGAANAQAESVEVNAQALTTALSQAFDAQIYGVSLKYKSDEVRNSNIVSEPNAYSGGPRTLLEEGELITDGYRSVWRYWSWGQAGSMEFVPRDRAKFALISFDGSEHWAYSLDPRIPNQPAGYAGLRSGPDPEGDLRKAAGGFAAGPLLGFVGMCYFRIDEMMEAGSVAVRSATEVINGSTCYALDFESKYGRGTVWIDPSHGYLPAQIHLNVRSGDFCNGVVGPSQSTDIALSEAAFSQIDGVWFVTGGAVEYKVMGPGLTEAARKRVTISGVKRVQDMNAINAFSKSDIKEGAVCQFYYQREWYKWQGGKLVKQQGPRME